MHRVEKFVKEMKKKKRVDQYSELELEVDERQTPVSTLKAKASSHGCETQKAGLGIEKEHHIKLPFKNLIYLESGLMSQQAIAMAINCFGQSLPQYF